MASKLGYSTTLTDAFEVEDRASDREWRLGFVVVRCPENPQLLGAWLPLDSAEDPKILGRGPSQASDAYPRLEPVHQRPGVNQQLGCLELPKISRTQLELCITAEQDVRIKNVGKAKLLLNGVETDAARAKPGDVLEIGSSLALFCTERPTRLPDHDSAMLHEFGNPDRFGIVGESAAAWTLRREIEFVAGYREHVLITGQSGSGKELVARAVASSTPGSKTYVARNAATLPEGLVDAELFGNVKNYPNPGMPERAGLIGAAHDGCLFLDEFAELSQATQTHLLRVLDEGEYHRLGEASARRANFRLIAATNQPLTALRHDVAARFKFRIHIPALAERREDIALIVRQQLLAIFASNRKLQERFAAPDAEPRVSAELIRKLMLAPLATNVREVNNTLWRCLGKSERAELEWHPASDSVAPPPDAAGSSAAREALLTSESEDRTETERIQRVLDEHNGSIEKAWRSLGLSSRHALARLVRKHKLEIRKKPG